MKHLNTESWHGAGRRCAGGPTGGLGVAAGAGIGGCGHGEDSGCEDFIIRPGIMKAEYSEGGERPRYRLFFIYLIIGNNMKVKK
jgi:hypothetical protein